MNTDVKYHVVIFKDNLLDPGSYWVAQVLEHDIAAQGNSISECLASIARAIAANLYFWQDPNVEIPGSAPSIYRDRYNNGYEIGVRDVLPVRVEDSTEWFVLANRAVVRAYEPLGN